MITKELLADVRADFDEAIAGIGRKHKMNISLRNIRYGQQNATGNIEMSLLDAYGVAQTPERTAWENHARLYQLDPTWLDQTFISNGSVHTITGLKVKAPNYPVLTESNDKTYKWPAETVKRLMEV